MVMFIGELIGLHGEKCVYQNNKQVCVLEISIVSILLFWLNRLGGLLRTQTPCVHVL